MQLQPEVRVTMVSLAQQELRAREMVLVHSKQAGTTSWGLRRNRLAHGKR